MRYSHDDLLPLRAFQRGPDGRIKPQGGKGHQEAPAPDPSIGQAQLILAKNAERQTDLAEKQQELFNNQTQPILQQQAQAAAATTEKAVMFSQELADSQIAVNKQQLEYSRQYHDRMVNTFYPMQDAAIDQAKNYNTEANQNQIASYAIGDNTAAFEAQRNADATKAKAYGIDPTSGAYQGMQTASGVAQAATSASAATRARAAAVQLGWGMQMDAIHMGDGLAAASMGSAQTAINAGSAASATNNSTVAAANNSLNNSLAVNSGTNQTYSGTQAGYGGANTATSASGGLGAQSYGTQVSAWNAQQQANAASSAGIGSAIGGIAGAAMSGGTAGFAGSAIGMGMKALSDIRLKENIEVVGMMDSGLTIYEFEYKPKFKDAPYAGRGRFRGLMAHEVERVIPSAVFTTPDGYKAVDYSQVI